MQPVVPVSAHEADRLACSPPPLPVAVLSEASSAPTDPAPHPSSA
jgi:hypothetical protein